MWHARFHWSSGAEFVRFSLLIKRTTDVYFVKKRLISSYKHGQVSYLLILNDVVLSGFSDINKGCAFLLPAQTYSAPNF